MNNKLLRIFAIGVFIALAIFIWVDLKRQPAKIASPTVDTRVWQFKSIDTMKYSRDPSAAKLDDLSFDAVIDKQVKDISGLGANYAAIATPYDDQFLPILTRWVNAARRYKLHVWFRGNFSGWEGWFGYSGNLSREDHLAKTRQFIQNNKDLFRDGDAFSPCPECENGGAGDPRTTGDVVGFRKFLISEYNACVDEFKKIGKNVTCNLASMNYDVANLVMDADTTRAMGNLIVIDHYVDTSQKLSANIDALYKKTGANIMLGEIGVPIPDINGKLTDQEQADWLDSALSLISKKKEVVGINYWVSVGGSTAIIDDSNNPKPAAAIIGKYFKLSAL